MATFKGIIFANRTAFENRETAVWNFYKAKDKKIDTTVVKRWSKGIDSLDDSKVLMPIDERLKDFPWSPEVIVDVDTTDPKWFNQNPEI